MPRKPIPRTGLALNFREPAKTSLMCRTGFSDGTHAFCAPAGLSICHTHDAAKSEGGRKGGGGEGGWGEEGRRGERGRG